MIPAPPGLVATYLREGTDTFGNPYMNWDHKPVVAFDDDGVPMIVGDSNRADHRRLVRADTYTNYDGMIQDPHPPIVSIIPADGWRVAREDADGTEWTRPLIGWAVRADGDVSALETDPDGLVVTLDPTGDDEYRIYHPEEPMSD